MATEPVIRTGTLAEFRPLENNTNLHTEEGTGMLLKSMEADGFVAPITAAADGEVLDGSNRLEVAADRLGLEAIVVEHDGTRPIIMVRTDIPNAHTPQAEHIQIAANRVAQVDLTWNAGRLDEIRRQDSQALQGLFSDQAIDDLLEELKQEPKEHKNREQKSYDFQCVLDYSDKLIVDRAVENHGGDAVKFLVAAASAYLKGTWA